MKSSLGDIHVHSVANFKFPQLRIVAPEHAVVYFLMMLNMIVMLKKPVHLIAFQLLENFILSWLSFKCAFFHSTVELKFLKIASNESSIIFYLTCLRNIYHTLVSSLQCFPLLIETSPEYIVDWNITNCFHFFNSNPPLLPKVLVDRPENYNIHYISIL